MEIMAFCHTVITTSSNFGEHKLAIMRDLETGMQTSKTFTSLKLCETLDKSYLVENEMSEQPIITTMRVNRFLQSRTGRHNKNTGHS